MGLWINLSVALGIGLLVGAERERRKGPDQQRSAAGIRTFALLALAGYLIALANLVFKGGIVAVTGGRTLFLRVLPVYVAALLTGLGILFFWP
jgi:uncharacterized membrane protein YhiD involved in acid resistance